jgi:deazaflavin-dependent oxidoreductase (nitroreductase family)
MVPGNPGRRRYHPTLVDDIGEQLTGWGKVARLRTRGRLTGRTAEAAVGYVEERSGSLLVAATTDAADWARNLDAEPLCSVRIGEDETTYVAERLEGSERADAVRALILRYGTPAERLGHGPAYRLRRVVSTDPG